MCLLGMGLSALKIPESTLRTVSSERYTPCIAIEHYSMGFGCDSANFVCMELTPQLIDHLAHLSRLEFSETEKQAIHSDLHKMIHFVEKLRELDTTGVTPLMHMGNAVNVLRDDVVAGSISTQDALKNAPAANEAFFRVPKVIRK